MGPGTLVRALRDPGAGPRLGKAAVSNPCSPRKRSRHCSDSLSVEYLYPQACFPAMNFSIHGARVLWKVGIGVRVPATSWGTSGSSAARRNASTSTLA